MCFETHVLLLLHHISAVWPWDVCLTSLCVSFTSSGKAGVGHRKVTHSSTVRITGFRIRRDEANKTRWESKKKRELLRGTLDQKRKWKKYKGWVNKLLRITEQAEKGKKGEETATVCQVLFTLCCLILDHPCEWGFFFYRRRKGDLMRSNDQNHTAGRW